MVFARYKGYFKSFQVSDFGSRPSGVTEQRRSEKVEVRWRSMSSEQKNVVFRLDPDVVCVPQAEGILRAWATPALQKDYGSDPVVTKIWNTTMTEVQ